MPANAPLPGVKLTPVGGAPAIDSVGAGVPVAVTLKVPADNTVKVVALTLLNCGGTGTPVGVTLTMPEGMLVSIAALVACTEHMYVVALVRPLTVIGEAAPLPITPPGLHVTRKFVSATPPVLPDAVKAIVAVVSPGVPVPMVGGAGAVGLMVMLCVTCIAGLKLALPA